MWQLHSSEKKYFQRQYSIFPMLSFMIPFLMVVASFAVQQVHPFGDKMILTVDLYHQYAPFIVEFRNKILSGDSLFHSWNIGLGTNFLAVLANYSASPLNLLMLLFPTKYVSDGIALIVCLRAGFTGLFMSLLLRDIDKNRKDLFLCAFSSMYALCGWVISYFWNIMWMDALMMLPLIVFGLRRLMRDRKPLLYCISLFLCVLSNFYSGYFVCLFLVVFAPVCYMTVIEKPTIRNFFRSAGHFSLYSLIGGGLAAILAYPTYMTLQHSSAVGGALTESDYILTHDMFDFFSRFFLGAYPNIRDGMANVYSGVLILLFLPLFFLCRNIRLKEKIGYGFLILFMYFGFSSRVLNFYWHGSHFPNQIPYRQAFIMSFLLVIIAYRVIRNLKTFTVSEITFTAMLSLAYLVLYEKFGQGKEGFLAIALTAVFVISYAIILRAIISASKIHRSHRYVLFGFIIAELIIASQLSIGMVSKDEGFTGWDFYGKKSQEVVDYLALEEAKSDGNMFVRAEIYPASICNEPALYDIKGVSVFSSTARESYAVFMKSMGLHGNGINSARNNGLTEVTASLFGVEYFIDLETSSPIPSVFGQIEGTDELLVFRNEDALSIGYMVSSDVLSFEVQQKSNPFITTNDFLIALGVGAVYEERSIIPGELVNATFTSGSPAGGFSFSIGEKETRTEISFLPEDCIEGQQMYMFESSRKSASVVMNYKNTDDSAPLSSSQYTRYSHIIDLGKYDPETWVSAKISWSEVAANNLSVFCYSVNTDSYEEMISTLGESQLEITSYDSVHLQGSIDAKMDGVMLLTISYDEGWTAKVDGEPAVIHNVGGALCGISLPKGVHDISLTYTPEGFGTGRLISIIALLALLMIEGGKYAWKTAAKMKEGRRLMTLQENQDEVALTQNEIDEKIPSAKTDEAGNEETVIPAEWENK